MLPSSMAETNLTWNWLFGVDGANMMEKEAGLAEVAGSAPTSVSVKLGLPLLKVTLKYFPSFTPLAAMYSAVFLYSIFLVSMA